MESEEYRKNILREILKLIKKKLLSGEMSASRAKKIAKNLIIKLKPNITLGNIFREAPIISNSFPELSSVLLPVIEEYQKRVDALKIDKLKNKLNILKR